LAHDGHGKENNKAKANPHHIRPLVKVWLYSVKSRRTLTVIRASLPEFFGETYKKHDLSDSEPKPITCLVEEQERLTEKQPLFLVVFFTWSVEDWGQQPHPE
jgi:hypothetical protein